MSKPDPLRDEALKRLNARADALERRNAKAPATDYGGQAVGQGYRLLGELTGGVLVGLALGFGVDAVAGSAPWGTIAGVLLGFAVSIWMAVRSAKRMSEQALKTHGPGQARPAGEDEDEGA